MREIVIEGGAAKPLWAGHPWVHAAHARERGMGEGDVARVIDAAGRTIGWGLVSDRSALRVRLLDHGEPPDDVEAEIDARIARACALRRRLFARPERTDAYRLVHAEGDGLPGLVVDRFAGVLVALFATGPMHARRERLAACLLRETGAASLVTRRAGFEAEEGIDEGDVDFTAGEEAPERVRAVEEGMVVEVEPARGQKTGHYADQRENRVRVAEVAAGAQVLDLFAGTGGFSVQALRHGAASCLAVETSARAAEAARRCAAGNGVEERLEVREEDVRHVLRAMKEAARAFDVVVCDPPNFYPRRGGDGHAIKAYRDLNVQALTRVRPGGFLATFACSARMRPEEWLDLVRSAARECRRHLRVLRELSAGPDHPVPAAAPESRYLSGLLAVVDA